MSDALTAADIRQLKKIQRIFSSETDAKYAPVKGKLKSVKINETTHDQLRLYCRDTGKRGTAVVEAAIKWYLEGKRLS